MLFLELRIENLHFAQFKTALDSLMAVEVPQLRAEDAEDA